MLLGNIANADAVVPMTSNEAGAFARRDAHTVQCAMGLVSCEELEPWRQSAVDQSNT